MMNETKDVMMDEEYWDKLAEEYEARREWELECSFGCLCGID